MKSKAVTTPLGLMYGRDAIYVDQVHYQYDRRKLLLEGSLNGELGSESDTEKFVPYQLTFEGVYYFRATELDLHFALDDMEDSENMEGPIEHSNWVEYTDSPLLRSAREEGKPELQEMRHFVLYTYDDVFKIGCRSYTLKLHTDLNSQSNESYTL
ncbi:hypothetical protein [Paenibacillus kandeliae]|uniref:hypothetical protein n=1 Tax=Paenibacillus kandeliae TaxID=3231269 RepID=UPI003459D433